MSEFSELLFHALSLQEVRSVTEIGAEFGMLTQGLMSKLKDGSLDRIQIIDPHPKPELEDLVRQQNLPGLHFIRQTSLQALVSLPASDCYLIDGDHNYHTVSNELRLIAAAAAPDQPFPLLILHDAAWPCARRDMYYAPDTIPESARHDHDYWHGVTSNSEGLTPDGFRSNGQFAWAKTEGGKYNGVLTAIEDFMATRADLGLKIIPAVFGLAIIAPKSSPILVAFESAESQFPLMSLLQNMESNRLRLYLHVLKLQATLDQVQANLIVRILRHLGFLK